MGETDMSTQKSETPKSDQVKAAMMHGDWSLQGFVEHLQQMELLLRDAMEYVEHSKACPIARGIEDTACDCGLDDVQRQWRKLNGEVRQAGPDDSK